MKPYVRTEEAPVLAPPASEQGILGWLWQNIFVSMSNFSTVRAAISSITMIVLSLFFGYALIWMTWTFLDFTIFSAIWSDPEGLQREACNFEGAGACWPYIYQWFRPTMIGHTYPLEEAWRVYTIYAILTLGVAWLLIGATPKKKWVAIFMLTIFPIIAFVFLNGTPVEDGSFGWKMPALIALMGAAFFVFGWFASRGKLGEVIGVFASIFYILGILLLVYGVVPLFAGSIDAAFGFEVVRTAKWGGLLLTLVVAVTGIIVSLPFGVLLALGRQSNAPLIKWVCIIFIEFWRGVPLIMVLFFSKTMLAFFFPNDVNFDLLLKALIGVTLFSSAYMAEVVRGGLQAIPKGQYEGGMSIGLSYWQQMRLIILPQALTTVIPGIVNTFIGLFKDTTLVLVISLFDILGIIQLVANKRLEWAMPTQAPTGYIFVAILFWIFCFGMSRYSIHMENKLHRGHR